MDELRQIFDRIDVVVRRRRNQSHAGHRIAQFGNVFGHLVSGKLSSFTGLGALSHLDLNLIGASQILLSHAEATACHLLDARAQTVTVFEHDVGHNAVVSENVGNRHAFFDNGVSRLEFGLIAFRIFTAFAGVALASDAVHGNGKRRMSLRRNGAHAHRARRKTLDDVLGGLHLINRNRDAVFRLKTQQTAQRHLPTALIVDD